VRVLKHARTLAHDQLVRDVVASLRGHFEPSPVAIKVAYLLIVVVAEHL